MKTTKTIKKIIEGQKTFLRETFGVKDLGIFGSYARGEQKEGSDLDILVEFSQPVGFFTFLELEEFLGKKLGVKVDLVTKNALKPAIGQQILRDVSYI